MTDSLYRIRFECCRFPACCGAFILCNFDQIAYDGWGSAATKFANHKQVWEDFEARLREELEEFIYDDGGYEGTYKIFCTLIKQQSPKFQQYLLSSGWVASTIWVNANTGNEITLYEKSLSSDYISSLRRESSELEEEDG